MSGLHPLLSVLRTMESEWEERIASRLIVLAIRLDPMKRVSTYVAQPIKKMQLTNATGEHVRTLTSPP